MAISKKTIESWGKLLGIDPNKIKSAMDDKSDVDLETPEVSVFSKADLATRDSSKYNEGKDAGEEMAVKAIKKDKGWTFEGKKVTDLVSHVEANSGTDETVKKLRENVTKYEGEITALKTQMAESNLRGKVMESMKEYGGLSKHNLLAIAQSEGVSFKENNGVVEVYRNNTLLKDDKLQTPLSVSQWSENYFGSEKKMNVVNAAVDPKSGRGGGNSGGSGGGKSYKLSDIQKEWMDANNGKSINSYEFQEHVTAKIKEAKDAGQSVDMSS